MPIGTGKGSLFGGGVSIEAGSQTFNSSGTFTVPPGLTKVNLTGKGGKGNDGTSGGGGPSGAGGAGGAGGASTFTPCGNPNYFLPSQITSRAGSPGGAGGAAYALPSSGAAGNSGTATTVFCTTVGNTGTGGTGGTGGHGANAGSPGGAGNSSGIQAANHSGNLVSGCRGNAGAAAGSNPTGAGGACTPALYHGRMGGYGAKSHMCIVYCSGPITIQWVKAYGGSGGGGAGVGNAGSFTCNTHTYPEHRDSRPGGYGFCCSPNYNAARGGNGGIGSYATGGASSPCEQAHSSSGSQGSAGLGDNQHVSWGGSNPSPPSGYQLGALGGSGGGGGGGGSIICKTYYRGEVGSGGGGGGSGGQAVYGNTGNSGNQGNPSTVNCVSVSAGNYPVVVGTCGTVTISWNAQ